jgi:hypothetical protein
MKYVIYNESERGFWSNEDGWVDLATATIFDGVTGNLPIGGRWLTEAYAQTISWPGCGNVVKTDGTCLIMTAVVTVSLAVSLAFDPDSKVPDEQELREILLHNFQVHPGLEDKGTALDLKYEVIDAHEE